jgi:deazaflavin-dependent oxidoreductase (nitroreductase family)
VLQLPIWLYRLNIGWIVGERFLLLEHTGRKSGALHQSVIEVVGHDRFTGAYFVVAAFGEKTDWLLNVKKDPMVTIQVKRRKIAVRARQVSEEEGIEILFKYAGRHPIAFRELTALITGKIVEPTEENIRQFIRSRPVIAFEP